jgi:hypothetical protein
MRINELLVELSFQGEPCTKDCSGHSAGYNWAIKHMDKDCSSKNPSFTSGCNVAKKQAANKAIKKPEITKEPEQDTKEPNLNLVK